MAGLSGSCLVAGLGKRRRGKKRRQKGGSSLPRLRTGRRRPSSTPVLADHGVDSTAAAGGSAQIQRKEEHKEKERGERRRRPLAGRRSASPSPAGAPGNWYFNRRLCERETGRRRSKWSRVCQGSNWPPERVLSRRNARWPAAAGLSRASFGPCGSGAQAVSAACWSVAGPRAQADARR
jgi:hypothetical protein